MGIHIIPYTLEAHKATHEAGGADEINVTGLDGVLTDAQVPIGHHTLHEEGNADALANPIAIGAMANLTNTKIWQGSAGNRPVEVAMPAAGAPTKEFFIPATEGTESYYDSNHCGYRIDAINDHARIEFYTPHDFSSITDAVLILIAFATASHEFRLYSNYGAQGTNKATHSQASAWITEAMTDNILHEYDISGILSSLAAGDYVGIKVLGGDGPVPNFLVLGVRLRYS